MLIPSKIVSLLPIGLGVVHRCVFEKLRTLNFQLNIDCYWQYQRHSWCWKIHSSSDGHNVCWKNGCNVLSTNHVLEEFIFNLVVVSISTWCLVLGSRWGWRKNLTTGTVVQVTVTSYSKPCGTRYLFFNKKNTIYIIPYVQLLLFIYSPTIYCVLQSSWAFLAGWLRLPEPPLPSPNGFSKLPSSSSSSLPDSPYIASSGL